jgi:transposase
MPRPGCLRRIKREGGTGHDGNRDGPQVTALEKDLQLLVTALVPELLGISGISVITAARILGETGDIRRFRS